MFVHQTSDRHWLICGLLLALLARCLLFSYNLSTDGKTYVNQAHEIRDGLGFRYGDHLTTFRPPGYPILMAAIFVVADDLRAVIVVQMVLSLASCYLVYAAIEPSSIRLARLAMFAMAVHPLISWRVGTFMTETFGVFLTALLVFLVSKIENNVVSSKWWALVTGAVCVALTLTTPPMIFLAASLWVVLVWRSRRNISRMSGLVLGALLLFVPWQIHCYSAVGHFEPLFYGRNHNAWIAGSHSGVENTSSGFFRWVQTWLKHDGERGIYWWEEWFDRVPADVFDSDQERDLLREQHHRGFMGIADPTEYDRAFADAAARRVANHPRYCLFGIQALRSVYLYVDMPQIGHAQMEYIPRIFGQHFLNDYASVGLSGAAARELKAMWSLMIYSIYILYPIAFIACSLATWRDARLIPVAIIVGTAAYTVVSAEWAISAVRHTLPFVPAWLFMLYYLPTANNWLRRITNGSLNLAHATTEIA